ncbi:MAG: LutB/LldF family L-lactate oxidation iron-sulfur protein [Acidimicrobiia bacterium]|nr:LutB/LldF family L-lactate oxidation iron-sulfur protein [Acidimicrobiia bacterium]MDH5293427.1 LutB/LldF family L-lactate oxidation iron-sulfur protein [Acidimicrobiia bacterium]
MSEPVTFLGRAGPAVGTPSAIANRAGARRFTQLRTDAAARYAPFDAMRDRARAIRLHTLANLGGYLRQFADSVEAAGGRVYFAADAAEARSIILGIARDVDARKIIKSKSMVSEEIHLNDALEADGREVVETDLGEFIIQLAGEAPSHIIAPAIHMTAADIGRLFERRLGIDYTDDADELNRFARAHLRRVFLEADMGISGVNFGVAESGSICTVTNEGNGRLTTTAPRVHVALMGMERLVPTTADLVQMIEVLARSGTGQNLSAYTNIVTGPRRDGDPDGPDELHVVILDNGRSRALAGPNAEILACIRCGACLNACPVYRAVGGHAYGAVYPGPIGAVLNPALDGVDPWSDLPFASTLCGACTEVCPVRIDIPRMLLGLRQEAMESGVGFGWIRPGMSAYARAAEHPVLWRAFLALGGIVARTIGRRGHLERLPFHASRWTQHRSLRAPAPESFRASWRRRRG